MNLNLIQSEIAKLIPESFDRIDENFNFKENKLAIQIEIGESIQDKLYCNDIGLKIIVTGPTENKMTINNKAINIDETINNYIFSNKEARVFRENVWLQSIYDNDKYNVVLLYTIRAY